MTTLPDTISQLDVLARHLTRLRPSLPGYDRNPVVLRPLILASIERLEGERK